MIHECLIQVGFTLPLLVLWGTLLHSAPQHRHNFLFSLSTRGDGRNTAVTPPIISSTATSKIGTKGSALISLPKATLPIIDPTRPITDCIPNAVDLSVCVCEGGVT